MTRRCSSHNETCTFLEHYEELRWDRVGGVFAASLIPFSSPKYLDVFMTGSVSHSPFKLTEKLEKHGAFECDVKYKEMVPSFMAHDTEIK